MGIDMVTMREDEISSLVRKNETYLKSYLRKTENLAGIDPKDPGLSYIHRELIGVIESAVIAFLCPGSKFHGNKAAMEHAAFLAEIMNCSLNGDGTLNTVNIASPPDTGFVVNRIGSLLILLYRRKPDGGTGIVTPLKNYMLKASEALLTGGVHTANHRWVISAALAYGHHFLKKPGYVRRIDGWLAEGIDIDSDGQFSERSSGIYSPVIVEALIRIARLLDKDELIDIARRHLETMLYYLHPDGRLDTLSSRRQDVACPASPERYYLPYLFMAARDSNGQFAGAAKLIAEGGITKPQEALVGFLGEPELYRPIPPPEPIPQKYHRFFKGSGLVRVRDNRMGASIFGRTDSHGVQVSGLSRNATFFSYFNGKASLQSLRIAPLFFSMGYFQFSGIEEIFGGYRLSEILEVPYFDQLDTDRHDPGGIYPLTSADGRFWGKMGFAVRKRINLQKLSTRVDIVEEEGGFTITITCSGTGRVPVAIEFSFSREGSISQVASIPQAAPLFQSGVEVNSQQPLFLAKEYGEYTCKGDTILFGPGETLHDWTPLLQKEVFGITPERMNNEQLVYSTVYTPFTKTIRVCSK